MNLRNFRIVALLEATSFLLLLLVAMPLKYGADQPIAVEIMGPIHGVLFIAYVIMVLAIRDEMSWNLKTSVLVLLGAVVPFGGYVVDRWLERTYPDQLSGRRTRTG
jgi:integral membrane protein